MQNQMLCTAITERAHAHSQLADSAIRVIVKENGDVVLSGHANSYIEKYLVEELVKKEGVVKHIVNVITVDLIVPLQKQERDKVLKEELALLQWLIISISGRTRGYSFASY